MLWVRGPRKGIVSHTAEEIDSHSVVTNLQRSSHVLTDICAASSPVATAGVSRLRHFASIFPELRLLQSYHTLSPGVPQAWVVRVDGGGLCPGDTVARG